MLKILALALALALFALQQLVALGSATPLLIALHNSAHLPWFALITWLVCLIVQPKHRQDLWRLMMFLVLLAVSSEVLQIFSKRDFSVLDIMANLSGATLVLLFYTRIKVRLVLAFCCVLIGLHPLIITSVAYWERAVVRPEFLPVNAVFLDNLLLKKSQLEPAVAPNTCGSLEGQPVHKLTFTDRSWPNIRMMDVMADWSDYQYLSLNLCNPNFDMATIWLSVHPEEKNEPVFYKEFSIFWGHNRVNIPINAMFHGQTVRVQDVKLYAHERENGRVLYVESVSLKKGRFDDCDSAAIVGFTGAISSLVVCHEAINHEALK